MTTTKHRPTVADLAPGSRFRARTKAQPVKGCWYECLGRMTLTGAPDLIIARQPGRASWRLVLQSAVVETSITPPRKADQ